jgi:hypothetical protein
MKKRVSVIKPEISVVQTTLRLYSPLYTLENKLKLDWDRERIGDYAHPGVII